MQTRKNFICGFIILALLFCNSGCDSYTNINHDVQFTLSNGSGLETHMWVKGESMSAANKLLSGSSRKVTYTATVVKDNPASYENVTVYVGRNGADLGYQSVKVTSDVLKVTAFYDGTYLSIQVN